MNTLKKIASFSDLHGESSALRNAISLAKKVADTDIEALITGESGTGKELFAEAIHANSSRRDKPLVVINCGALPDTLLEAELFGYEKGAFTGAQFRREGQLKYADNGTLVLDEIADMSPSMQVKVLRAIEQKEFTPLGRNGSVSSDFRLICATNKDLRKCVEDGTFREDLYYRIRVVQINLPPLRARREDIPLLANHFVDRSSVEYSCEPKKLTSEAMQVLLRYSWPGNIRELENVIKQMVVVSDGPVISPTDLPEEITHQIETCNPCSDTNEILSKQIERFIKKGATKRDLDNLTIRAALRICKGNKTQAAKLLVIGRSTVSRRGRS